MNPYKAYHEIGFLQSQTEATPNGYAAAINPGDDPAVPVYIELSNVPYLPNLPTLFQPSSH